MKKSINKLRLQNGMHEQIAVDLESELEFTGLETSDEIQVNAVSQHATSNQAETPKPTGRDCKNQDTT